VCVFVFGDGPPFAPAVLCGKLVATCTQDRHLWIWIYPWISTQKICGYGYGYGWEISYPRQAWKCMVPPAPEHSQPALLTSESIRVTWHCPA